MRVITICVEDGERKSDKLFVSIDDAIDWLYGIEDGEIDPYDEREKGR